MNRILKWFRSMSEMQPHSRDLSLDHSVSFFESANECMTEKGEDDPGEIENFVAAEDLKPILDLSITGDVHNEAMLYDEDE